MACNNGVQAVDMLNHLGLRDHGDDSLWNSEIGVKWDGLPVQYVRTPGSRSGAEGFHQLLCDAAPDGREVNVELICHPFSPIRSAAIKLVSLDGSFEPACLDIEQFNGRRAVVATRFHYDLILLVDEASLLNVERGGFADGNGPAPLLDCHAAFPDHRRKGVAVSGKTKGYQDGQAGLSRTPTRHEVSYSEANRAEFFRGYEDGYNQVIKPGASAPESS
jgi:hypothetical protein